MLAHNGTLKELHAANDSAKLAHYPIGDTDSELAFCLLLERMRDVWTLPGEVPPWEARLDAFAAFVGDLKSFGTCNLLYGDGDVLFVPMPIGGSMRRRTAASENRSRPDFACETAGCARRRRNSPITGCM